MVGRLDIKCPSHVSTSYVVVLMPRVGSMEVTLQWVRELFGAKSVFIGAMAVVIGQPISASVTAEDSLFTNFIDHLLALFVTVATECHLHQVYDIRYIKSSSKDLDQEIRKFRTYLCSG